MALYRIFVLLLLGSLFIPNQSNASHIGGYYYTYECLNPCTVRVNLRIFRQCTGGPILPTGYSMVTSACSGPTSLGPWSSVVYTDITPLAPAVYTSCTIPGTISGIEEGHAYQDFDWCAGATCNEVELRWTQCCWANSLTNVNSTNLSYGIDGVMMGRPGGNCNNSPVFNAVYPYITTNAHDTWFDLGATDPDGDSLTYQWEPLRNGYPGMATYNLGYSPTQFFGPNWNVTINPSNGMVHFIPMPGSVGSVGVGIRINEYRGGVLIGSLHREFSMVALASNSMINNLSPNFASASMVSPGTLTGGGSTYTVSANDNTTLIVELATGDPDANFFQSIEWLSSSAPLTGAYLADGSGTPTSPVVASTANGLPTARLYWPTPVPGTYSVTFRVWEVPNITNMVCADTVELQLTINATPPPTDSVWPGDANDDLIANNLDLLTVALGYGDTGPVRVGATNAWVAQLATLWGTFTLGGPDEAHTDCDGSGVIDFADTVAINLNYGLTHTKQGSGLSPVVVGGGVPVYCEFLVDSASVGDTVEVGVFIGDNNNSASNVLGVAFSFNYDQALVDSASVGISYDNSWFSTPSTHLHVSRDFYSSEVMEVGFARNDHQGRSGMGQVATIALVLTDNIDGKTATLDTEVLYAGLTNITLIGANGQVIPVDLRMDSLVVWQVITQTATSPENGLQVWPNPFTSEFSLTLPAGNWNLTLVDLQGRSLAHWNSVSGVNRFPMSFLPQGSYFLRAEGSEGVIVRRVTKF